MSALIYLFLAYLIGHGLAYASGELIQKTADSVFGKTSGVIIWESLTGDENRNQRTRSLIKYHIAHSFRKHNWFSSAFRAMAHLPVIIVYFLVYKIGVFGFYSARMPESVISIIRDRLKKLNIPDIPVAHKGFWFKPLEHYVMNNYSSATSRMYNYLVISGLFRTLSLLFLLIIWLQIYYDLHWALDGDVILKTILSDGNYSMPFWQIYGFLITCYFISLFSFLKFQRRYVEEAMFAFALTKDSAFE